MLVDGHVRGRQVWATTRAGTWATRNHPNWCRARPRPCSGLPGMSLVGDAKRFLAGYSVLVEGSWMQKWHMGMDGRPYGTRSEEAFKSLREVWLTEAGFEDNVGFEKRMAVWQDRFGKLEEGFPGGDGVSLDQECRTITSTLACGLCEAEGVQPEEVSERTDDKTARG